MREILTVILLLTSITSFGQRLTLENWENEIKIEKTSKKDFEQEIVKSFNPKEDYIKVNDYLKIPEKLGNSNITNAFKYELKEKCSQNYLDCSSVKTGKFKLPDEIVGETIIERSDKFQIEENKKYGFKLKLKVTWINDCTYQLEFIEDLLNPENKDLPTTIVTCSIKEITENGYIQISSSDSDPKILKSELIRIK